MLVVNLFGAPSSGKSTLALLIGGLLKTQHPGIATEVPDEVAKFLVYDESMKALRCQPFILGNQHWQIARCDGHADVVVTDSPVLLSAVYGGEYGQDTPAAFVDVCRHYHYAFPSLNYYVERKHAYETKARVQDEDDAARIGRHIIMTLTACDVVYETVTSTWDDAHHIVAQISKKVENLRCQSR